MTLAVHLALAFHIFIAVAIVVIVCGRHGIGLFWPVQLPDLVGMKAHASMPPSAIRRVCLLVSSFVHVFVREHVFCSKYFENG